MHISNLISLDRVACNIQINSKKRALEELSALLAAGHEDAFQSNIFNQLLERERLGSTGLGQGVAIPHCRISNIDEVLIAFISLDTGIEFDATDQKPVDLLLAILVPEECNEAHLKILASAAEMFSDTQFCDLLRSAKNNQNLYQLIANLKPSSISA